jgi:hypothetical protein
MGDTPYVIDADNLDRYPFMGPWPPKHDVAVISVTPSKTVVGQGYSLSISITAENQGDYTETFNVTVYYGNGTLTPEQWDIFWSMGDCNRDGYINQTDVDIIERAWGSKPGEVRWDPRADLDGDGSVDGVDVGRCGKHLDYEIWKYFLSGGTIGTRAVTGMPSGSSTSLTFTWNTTGIAYGNYTLSAYAEPVPGETDTTDNNLTDGWVTVTILGDVNGDFKCDGKDIAIIAKAYGSLIGQPAYVPNADINNDGKIDGKDIAVAAKYYGTHYP